MQNEKDEEKVNEPQPGYGTHANAGELRFFKSFKEAEDYDNKWLASLTPEQHLHNAVQLIKRHYKNQLDDNPNIENNFTID